MEPLLEEEKIHENGEVCSVKESQSQENLEKDAEKQNNSTSEMENISNSTMQQKTNNGDVDINSCPDLEEGNA